MQASHPSHPKLWRLDESVCELGENEHGKSAIEKESNLAKFTADMLKSNCHKICQNGHLS